MRVQLLINERSRRGRELGPAVRVALQHAGIDAIERAPAKPASVDAIVCAGGDGTLLSAIDSAIASGVPLGVIPLGTFNDLARTLGIPLDVEAAVRVVANGAARSIDVGEVNGAYFVNEASIGVSSRVARLQTPEIKRRFGVFGVVWTALQAVRYSTPIRVEVRFGDRSERLRTVQLTIANSYRFGGVLNVQDAAIDDGWLDLYSVDIEGMREAFAVARTILIGTRRDAPGLRTFRAQVFDVVTRRPHHIVADGEPAGQTPATFRVLPKALRVFTPQ
jgi:diacylglycerol kinase (ATP)